MSNVAVIPEKNKSVTVFMADRFGMEPAAFESTLRATVIKPDKNGRAPSREEFAAFLLVAKQYDLNPITKEIFAFTDRGAVTPIVSVDGWAKLINTHPQCDGVTFDDHLDDKGALVSITCKIYRKDRSHPTTVTEYMSECKRDTDTWRKWPRRMLRHKALIQAARYAFGFSGIYDEDEGERITESARPTPPTPPTPPAPPPAQIEAKTPPTPPRPPKPPEQAPAPSLPEPALETPFDSYRAALAAATCADDVETAWNEIVEPAMQANAIDQDTYESMKVLENETLERFEQ